MASMQKVLYTHVLNETFRFLAALSLQKVRNCSSFPDECLNTTLLNLRREGRRAHVAEPLLVVITLAPDSCSHHSMCLKWLRETQNG